MKNNLVPVTITDKNNRVTTVYRKPEDAQGSTSRIPAVKLPSKASELKKSQPLLASLGLESVGDRNRREAAELAYGADEKQEIIARLTKLHSGFKFPLPLESHYLESYQIMDNLISRDPDNIEFAQQTHARFVSLDGKMFRNWAYIADRNYDAMVTNRVITPEALSILPGFISAALYFHERQNPKRVSDEQERNYLLLNLAADNSSLEGTRIRQGSNWGLLACHDNAEMEAFALSEKDPDRIQRVCDVIRSSKVVRFQEVVAVADGDTIPALADGAL